MNADLKPKWLAALRSGEYEQGQRKLRKNDKYCCLGVLCDIMPEIGWDAVPYPGEAYRAFDIESSSSIGSISSMPGERMLALAGLGKDSLVKRPSLPGGQEVSCEASVDPQATLINMNDGADNFFENPQSFEQIADWIEENL